MLTRPAVRSHTGLPDISPPLPQANAGGTTADILQLALKAACARAKERTRKPSCAQRDNAASGTKVDEITTFHAICFK